MLFDFDRFSKITASVYADSPYSLAEVLEVFRYYFEQYLDRKEDRPKTPGEWEDVEDRVSVIMDIVCNVIFECKLAYADEEAVMQYLETAKQLQAAKAVHDARDAIADRYRNKRIPDTIMRTINDAFSLPDEQALSVLQTIEKGTGCEVTP